MNRYELEYAMNLSGLGECFDFLGVDVNGFSATNEALMMEERVQTSPKYDRRRKDISERDLSSLLWSFHDE